MKSLSCIRLLATPWTAAHQAPPSMGFARQEYWNGLQLPSLILHVMLLLLLLSRFSRVRLCATPQTAAHQAPVPGILQARALEWAASAFSARAHTPPQKAHAAQLESNPHPPQAETSLRSNKHPAHKIHLKRNGNRNRQTHNYTSWS